MRDRQHRGASPRDYSPFTPGLPVPVEFFVGRADEVRRLSDLVARSATGTLGVAFVAGERGIGKSSLAAFVRGLSDREHRALGLHTFLGGVTELEEMVRRVFDRLLKESIDKKWESKITRFFGDRIRRVGLFGVSLEFEAPDRDVRRLVHDFAPAMKSLIQAIEPDKSVVLIVLDDINGLAESEAFANWLKSLVDEIATSGSPLPLCLMLVGLEERRQSLIRLQPSLARVFDVIEIRAWSDAETEEFFRQAFESVGVTVADDALQFMARFAGGLPVLAHEIGDAAFKVDDDSLISLADAESGVLAAADIVGRKYLEPRVFRVLRSQRYLAILRKIAGKGQFFTRNDVRSRLSAAEQKVLDNFLRRMRELGVIAADPERGAGAYRFTNLLHYLYFSLEAERARASRGDESSP